MIPIEDLDKVNAATRKWMKKVVHEIVQDMQAKGVRHRDYSRSKTAIFQLVKSSLRLRYGAPERVAITFPRHLVYVKYGVGKYRGIGSGKETPKDIVDNIIEKNLPELADMLAEYYADICAKRLFIDKSRGL